MQRAHEMRAATHAGAARGSWWAALGFGGLALAVMAGLLLLLHPTAADEAWFAYRALRTSGQLPAWVDPALRIALLIGCASVGMHALVGFARGVQRAPFAWLSPLMLGFGLAVMAWMRAAPPLPVSEPAFYVVCALFLLGGGAVLHRPGWSSALLAVGLMVTPFAALLGAHAHVAGGLVRVPGVLTIAAASHGFVLLVISAGIALVAYSARAEIVETYKPRLRHGHHGEADTIEDALERARISELRVEAAQHRVQVAEERLSLQSQELEAALAIQDGVQAMTPRRLATRLLVSGFVCLAIMGLLLGAYVRLYQPLRQKLAVAQAQAMQQGHDLSALKLRMEREQAQWTAQLQEARSERDVLVTEQARLQSELAAAAQSLAAQAAAPVAEPAVAPEPERPAKSRAAKAKSHRSRRARARAAEDAQAKPAAARSTPSRAREAISDDPIAGLDL